MGARVLDAVFGETLAEARGQAAGERDHALGVARDLLEVDGRLAALQSLQEAGRGELDEVAVAGVVGGQQGEVVALNPRAAGIGSIGGGGGVIVHEIYLATDDRLDAMLGTGLVELHRAVHHAVIGETEGWLLELSGTCGERIDLAGAVEQGVLGVHVQMGAGEVGHRCGS